MGIPLVNIVAHAGPALAYGTYTPLAFGLLAAFVAWGRQFKAPIAPRS
jgi:hypothetical protein